MGFGTANLRPREQHGVDYYYVTKDEFKDIIAKDGFIEQCVYGEAILGD